MPTDATLEGYVSAPSLERAIEMLEYELSGLVKDEPLSFNSYEYAENTSFKVVISVSEA